jgi:hypothetical protein
MVNLHFFFKRDVLGYIPKLIRREYSANPIVYYDEPSRNHETKYRLSSCELRIEFYLDVIQNFATQGGNFFCVYTSAKCMLAANVETHRIGGLLSLNQR